MRDALKKSKVVFQLGHHARQATCALQAKELIAQGILGPITLVRTGRFKSLEPGASELALVWLLRSMEPAGPGAGLRRR